MEFTFNEPVIEANLRCDTCGGTAIWTGEQWAHVSPVDEMFCGLGRSKPRAEADPGQ